MQATFYVYSKTLPEIKKSVLPVALTRSPVSIRVTFTNRDRDVKKIKIIIGAICAVFVITLATILLVPDVKSEQAGLIKLCSDITRGAMKSPGSYKMNSSQIKMVIGLPELGVKDFKEEGLRNDIMSGEIPYRQANVTIQQEAQNSYGVSLSGTTYCLYAILGDAGNASYRIKSVNIDNKQISDFDITLLSNAKASDAGKNNLINKLKYLEYFITGKI